MVNLFVALIVSDIEELKREGGIQETVNKAHHVLHYENVLSVFQLFHRELTEMEQKEAICTHSICFNCPGRKVSLAIQQKLHNIVEARDKRNFR